MIDPKVLDELAKRLAETLPAGVRSLQGDVSKNFHAALESAFARLDLVTREEFDAQAAVLARTRAKLEQIEQQLRELEQQLPPGPSGGG